MASDGKSRALPALEPIKSLWIGPRLSPLEQLCAKSFMAHGHPFHLYLYEDVKEVPKGVEIKDANAIIPEAKMAAYPSERLDHRSDWFRWTLIALEGGWWADMDMVCLKPLDFAEEIIITESDTCLFKFPPAHPLPQSLAFYTANPDTPAPWSEWHQRLRKFWRRHRIPGWQFWPYRVSELAASTAYYRALCHFGLADRIMESYLFTCCKSGDDTMRLFYPDPEGRALYEDAYCAHLYNQAMRKKGLDMNAAYDKTSPFEVLKRRYGV